MKEDNEAPESDKSLFVLSPEAKKNFYKIWDWMN